MRRQSSLHQSRSRGWSLTDLGFHSRSVFVHVCLCVGTMRVRVLGGNYAHVEVRRQSCFPSALLETRPLAWCCLCWACRGMSFGGCPCLYFPSPCRGRGITHSRCHACFYMGSWDSSLGPHACMQVLLSFDPSSPVSQVCLIGTFCQTHKD